MNCSQAKQIKIEDFLRSINVRPDRTRKNGTVLMYKAPYRNETNASFEVSKIRNMWYDHGAGTGGNIIDLVMIIKQTDLKGSLEYLTLKNFEPFSFYQQNKPAGNIQDRIMEIIKIKPLIDPALIEYLNERKISLETARIYLKEIIYKNWNSKINDYKIYRALGLENNQSGFELRNKYFKGCTSKYYTTVPGINNEQLNIFEGFFDFLSALELSKTKKLKFDSLILNSVALKEKTLSIVSNYQKLNLFLDNDPAGIETVNFYQKNHKNVKDFSVILYPFPYKDLNEFLIRNTNSHI
jgi:hypothetical protein